MNWTFTDEQFLSSREKQLVLKAWIAFLKSECRNERFTKRLYDHLHLHCSFIAHFDRQGFYATYFREGVDALRFLSQFDARGEMRSIEYGFLGSGWIDAPTGADLNRAMVEEARAYIPRLIEQFTIRQRTVDLARARLLLAKHNIEMPDALLAKDAVPDDAPEQLSFPEAA